MRLDDYCRVTGVSVKPQPVNLYSKVIIARIVAQPREHA